MSRFSGLVGSPEERVDPSCKGHRVRLSRGNDKIEEYAVVAKLVDAAGLGPAAARRGGSSPLHGTR